MKRTWSKTLAALLCLAMMLALVPETSVAAGSDDYPEELKNAARDSIADYWNFLNRECTSFVAFRLNDTNGVAFHNRYNPLTGNKLPADLNADKWGGRWGNAADWKYVADSIGVPTDKTPAVGAVAYWSSGHVAWVEQVLGDEIMIEEYNVDYQGQYNRRRISKSSPTCYIHVHDITNATFDINGYLDGQSVSTTDGYGTFDIVIDGKKVASGVSEYRNTELKPGMQYTITNVKATKGKTLVGIRAGGDYTGPVLTNSVIALEFRTINASTWLKNHSVKKKGTYGGHTYYYYADKVTWAEANACCAKLGGHLVSIGSAAENQFIGNLTGQTTAWIGLTDSIVEGRFLWSNGASVSYTNWAANEPINYYANLEGREDYGAIIGADIDATKAGQWNDIYSYAQYGFVCEIDDLVQYTLDVNGWVDGKELDDIEGIGTFDSYINGTKTENDIHDYYNEILPIGTKYEFKDIKGVNGYEYVGVKKGSLAGTMAGNTRVILEFARPTVVKYSVAYDANGGKNPPANQEKIKGQALTLSSVQPIRDDVVHDLYDVTFDANGGTVNKTCLTAARYTRYTFKNWNTYKSGDGVAYAPGARYTADANLTLYAQWTSSTVTTSMMLPTPERIGYEFKGWAPTKTAASGVTGKYTPSGNVTLYAIWQKEDLSAWSTTKPTNVPESQIETATQYRYSDKIASGGWTLTGSGTIDYVKSWPGGFNTANSLYGQYNKTPKTEGITGNTKVEVTRTVLKSYIYWHWCWVSGWLPNDNYNVNVWIRNEDHEGKYYQYFTAYETSDLEGTHDDGHGHIVSDWYYAWRETPADGSWWWQRIPVYRQTYKVYTGSNSTETWSPWSEWTMTRRATSDTRREDSRTVYRVKENTLPPAILTQPVSTRVISGDVATFTVVAANADTHQWYYRTSASSKWVKIKSGTKPTLKVRAKAAYNGYQYACDIKNVYGKTTTAKVKLLVEPNPPKITTQPRAVTVNSGDTATFTVVATNAATYQWYYRTSAAAKWTKIKSGTSATLKVKAKSAYNGFQYACDIKNDENNKVTTKVVTLTVIAQPPTITVQPKPVTVERGKTATFTVKANNADTYQWFYRTSAKAKWTKIKSAKTATLKVKTKLTYNGYEYACDVRNEDGKTTTEVVTLTVLKSLPTITTQPANVTVTKYNRATFTVKASNADSFQWYYRKSAADAWIKIKGATKATYYFKAKLAQNGYQYACDIKNVDGKVTTRVATLTVNK